MKIADYLKSHIDPLRVFEPYGKMERRGPRYFLPCHLHIDKTPSLAVDKDGRWHCFSCSAGGDLISFVQSVEGVDFVRACRLLVERFQIPAPVKLHNRAVRQKIQELEQAGDKLGALAMIDQLKRRAA